MAFNYFGLSTIFIGDYPLVAVRHGSILTIGHRPNICFRAWLDMWERALPDLRVTALPDTCETASPDLCVRTLPDTCERA